MKKFKVMNVFGTRPEAAKMAPVILALRDCPALDVQTAVTAQHREQLDQVLQFFGIVPTFDLDLMKPRQTLAEITSAALTGLEGIFQKAEPDLILVHGDTTTTMAASLAAFYCRIPLGHVEAGLRTYDKFQPFPEEINRRIASTLADMHFAPTALSKENLIKENIPAHTIIVTGNTAIDCLQYTLKPDYSFSEAELNELDFSRRIITMTAHRRENWGRPLANICNAVKKLAEKNPAVEIVYPVHLNPAVRETVFPILSGLPNVRLLNPLNVIDMHNLMNRSFLVLTDSGGLQEEVPSMGKPVVVLRNVTERPEAVEAGTVLLAGVEEENIYEAAAVLLHNPRRYQEMAKAVNPFGDGRASERILAAILERWKLG